MKDLHNNIKVARALSPAAAVTDNTAQASQIIDRQGFESLEFVIQAGGLADADVTTTVLIEDGDDAALADAAAVADAQLLGTESGAAVEFDEDNETHKIGYVGNKRYVRMTITPANNTGNLFLAAVAILGHPSIAPRDSQEA